jgi:hypothetical protein
MKINITFIVKIKWNYKNKFKNTLRNIQKHC